MTQAQRIAQVEQDRWQEALDWHAIFGSGSEGAPPPDKVRPWQDWISDAQNRRVYDQLTRLVGGGVPYPAVCRPTREQIEADEYDGSVSLAVWRAKRNASPRPSRPLHGFRKSPTSTLIAVSAALAIGMIGYAFLAPPARLSSTSKPDVETFQTQAGEIRNVHLEDGSDIIVGARTSLSVQFTARLRFLTLTQGEALFKVAHDRSRPFVVAAGARTITALGTAFVVRRESDRVMVAVTDGSVEVVEPPNRPSQGSAAQPKAPDSHIATSARLLSGQQLSYEDQGVVTPVMPADPQAVTAWAEGRLQFEDEPLADVVSTVRRYSHRDIEIDTDAAQLHYTGLVFANQVEDWLCGLEKIYSVEVVENGGRIAVRSRDPSLSEQSSFCRRP